MRVYVTPGCALDVDTVNSVDNGSLGASVTPELVDLVQRLTGS